MGNRICSSLKASKCAPHFQRESVRLTSQLCQSHLFIVLQIGSGLDIIHFFAPEYATLTESLRIKIIFERQKVARA